jgi:hypothetical protein
MSHIKAAGMKRIAFGLVKAKMEITAEWFGLGLKPPPWRAPDRRSTQL